jgi:hypothetical protein
MGADRKSKNLPLIDADDTDLKIGETLPLINTDGRGSEEQKLTTD